MAPAGQGEGRGALPTCRGGAADANIFPAPNRKQSVRIWKQSLNWMKSIEKRAPTAPRRLKHCDWPNVERTQSRHEMLAASVVGKTRQDSYGLFDASNL